jgi:hypothetical protein
LSFDFGDPLDPSRRTEMVVKIQLSWICVLRPRRQTGARTYDARRRRGNARNELAPRSVRQGHIASFFSVGPQAERGYRERTGLTPVGFDAEIPFRVLIHDGIGISRSASAY